MTYDAFSFYNFAKFRLWQRLWQQVQNFVCRACHALTGVMTRRLGLQRPRSACERLRRPAPIELDCSNSGVLRNAGFRVNVLIRPAL
jgi:hypothetical protein